MFLGTYRLYRTDNAEAPQRRRRDAGSRSAGDLTSGCTGAAPNGARGCFISRDRRGRRRRRRVRRHRRRLDPGQPRRGRPPTRPTWQPRRRGTLPEPAGQPDRGRPLQLADRLRGVRRLRRGHARQQRPRVRDHRRRPALEQHHRRTCRTCPVNSVVLDPADAEHALRRHRRRRLRHAPTAARRGSALGSGMPKVARLAARLRRLARRARGRHARARRLHADDTGRPRRRSWSRRPTRACRSARAAPIHYTITVRNIGNAAATGVTVTDPCPANTTFVSAERRRRAVGGKRALERQDRPGRRQHHAALRRADLGRAAGLRDRRSSTTGSSSRRRRASPRPAARTRTPIAPAHGVASTPTAQTGGARGRSAPRPSPSTSPTTATSADTYTAGATGELGDDGLRPDVHDADDHHAVRRAGAHATCASRSPCPRAPPTATTDTTHAHGDVGRQTRRCRRRPRSPRSRSPSTRCSSTTTPTTRWTRRRTTRTH